MYERDYKILTKEEQVAYDKAKAFISRYRIVSVERLFKYHDMMPTAGYHFDSLFPNNHLNHREIDKSPVALNLVDKFEQSLNSNVSERKILDFINSNRAYYLIASILKFNFYFGHHGSYIFREFPLPPNFIADYLIVGKNSGGYEFVFVELESANSGITLQDGSFGETIRKGLKQVNDWHEWLEANFQSLRLVFEKSIKNQTDLPKEFFVYDSTRIHFAVVAGRRNDYKEKTYRLRRKLHKSDTIRLLHYDNIIDATRYIISHGAYY